MRQEQDVDAGQVDGESFRVCQPDIGVRSDVEEHGCGSVSQSCGGERRESVTGDAQVVERHDAVMTVVLADRWDAAEQIRDLRNLWNPRVDAGERVGGVVDDDGDGELIQLGQSVWLGVHRVPAFTEEWAAGLRTADREIVAPGVRTTDHGDGQPDQPDAPQDVAGEVDGVDDGQVQRGEHAEDDHDRRDRPERGECPSGEAGPEASDDEQCPRGGEEVSEGFADHVAEDGVRCVEVVAGACGRCRIGASGVAGEAGHEQWPSQQTDGLDDCGGDAGGYGELHPSVVAQLADSDGDRREQRGGGGQDREPDGDAGLVLAEPVEDLAGGFLQDVGIVEDAAECGEPGVGEQGGRDQRDGREFAVHDASFAGLFRYHWTVDSMAVGNGVDMSPKMVRNLLSSTTHDSVNW